MESVIRSLSKLVLSSPRLSIECLHQPKALATSGARVFSTTSATSDATPRTPSSRIPRHRDLMPSALPDLSKIDPILDYDPNPPATLDHPKLFFPNRPNGLVFNVPKDDLDESQTPLSPRDIARLQKKPLVIKRVVNMNSKGKQPSMYALVVVGNGDGLAGYGEGKDDEAARAVRKATNRAIKNLRYFERYDDRTVFMDLKHKFHATQVVLRSRPPGFGNRSNHIIHEICRCVGIQDISGKVRGSRNPMNVIKATFEALDHQRLPNDIAKMRGKKVLDVQHVYYGAQ
ncbi:ribosomal protein S5, C-terminal domain-containing protein [Endogone sp. FLAS-F59071]|nr:ribosomal protein S5, C-terminal domain-containing protein [Endogone sp. FLAS-F59071]|eukprot:RUS22138.1 ribosomal protein S5, C-terminal domain-containing protein [Endogone sp. FLAS-F59071]